MALSSSSSFDVGAAAAAAASTSTGWGPLAAVDRAILDVLGGPVTYEPGTGADPVLVTGIFDATYLLASPSVGEVGLVSSGPAVFLLLSDLPTDPETDDPHITVGSVTYRVREPRKDGQGGVLLLLQIEG